MQTQNPTLIAKITWIDPNTNETHELVLAEGATVGIGRLEMNDICIREQHVSRQHAVISYRDGVFTINDLGSANGVFVNDVRVEEPYPLVAGDTIRLYVPTLIFDAMLDDADALKHTATLITAVAAGGKGTLTITNGAQEGSTIPLVMTRMTIGRATPNAEWQIALKDPSVSRPHARLELLEESWVLYDLGSSNGTTVNSTSVTEKGRLLRDGDVITFGGTVALFRTT